MAKAAVYYEEAQRLYVEQGFKLDIIVELLKHQVARKTLFNWKESGNWDKKKKAHIQNKCSLQDSALKMLQSAADKALLEPSDKTLRGVERSIKICERLGVDLKLKEEGKEKKKAAPEDIAKAIRKILKVPTA